MYRLMLVLCLTAACGPQKGPALDDFAADATDDHFANDTKLAGRWGRLFIQDAAAPRITVVEVATAETLTTFELDAAPSLSLAQRGRYVFATFPQTDEPRAPIAFDGGIWVEDHLDHVHKYRYPPVRIDTPYAAAGVTQFVSAGGWSAFFSPTAAWVLSDRFFLDETIAPVHFALGAHDGFVAPFAKHFVTARPAGGLDVRTREDAVARSFDGCAQAHHAYSLLDRLFVSCADEVVIVSADDDQWQQRRVSVPGVTTLATRFTLRRAFAHVGPELVAVDADDGAVSRLDLGAEICGVVSEPGTFEEGWTKIVAARTADGKIHVVDGTTMSEVRTIDGLAPAQCDALFTLGPNAAYVAAGTDIVEYDLGTGALTRRIPLSSAPGALLMSGNYLPRPGL